MEQFSKTELLYIQEAILAVIEISRDELETFKTEGPEHCKYLFTGWLVHEDDIQILKNIYAKTKSFCDLIEKEV